MPTLAELRARKGVRPKGHEYVTLVSGQHLYAELAELQQEKAGIKAREAARQESDTPRKTTDSGGVQRLAEIDARVETVREEMREHQGRIALVGMTGGEWQRWKDEHPPREDHRDDDQYSGGRCNVTDLIATLGTFVTEWDGETLQSSDWATMADQVIYDSLRNLASAVVVMHELEVPKLAPKEPSSPSPSLETGSDETA